MVIDEIKHETTVFMDRHFLSSEELIDIRKSMIEKLETASPEERAAVYAYWLELLREQKHTFMTYHRHLDIDLYNMARRIDLKTYGSKLLMTIIALFASAGLLLFFTDLFPLIEKDVIRIFS